MKKISTLLVIAAFVSLSGCASTSKDPLEGINRGIYKFNDVADRYAMKPVAKAYKAVTPSPVRTGISNFFSNLGTLTTVVNDLLQLKFAQAFTDAGRFVINSTFGLAGFVDVASMDKIEKHNEDFGQTLGYWGVGSGPYLVLPILGPSSVRDFSGLVFDTATSDPITYLHNIGEIRTHNQVRLAQLVDKRTQLLDATDLVDNASIDPYAFMRDAYLQRRASLVQDGLVPKELIQDDFEPADVEPNDKKADSTLVEPSADPVVENTYPAITEAPESQVAEPVNAAPTTEPAAAAATEEVPTSADAAAETQTTPETAADAGAEQPVVTSDAQPELQATENTAETVSTENAATDETVNSEGTPAPQKVSVVNPSH